MRHFNAMNFIIRQLITFVQNSCAHVCSQFVLVLISFYRKYYCISGNFHGMYISQIAVGSNFVDGVEISISHPRVCKPSMPGDKFSQIKFSQWLFQP